MSIDKKRRLLHSGLIVGAIGGAAAAFFLAPQKGLDTKKWLVKNANNLTQKSIVKTQEALVNFEIALEESIAKNQRF